MRPALRKRHPALLPATLGVLAELAFAALFLAMGLGIAVMLVWVGS